MVRHQRFLLLAVLLESRKMRLAGHVACIGEREREEI
jgi:hypothetical protein